MPEPLTKQHSAFCESVQRLNSALQELTAMCDLLQLAPLHDREWYELLRQKLLPQLKDDAFLVVAVVGGTNIGKSVVFNHVAGVRASSTSPLASGTKHPVCLVPDGFHREHDLASVFVGFQIQQWSSSESALLSSDRHLLFCRISPDVPDNLLILDTPDIDSDAQVNWVRADSIRRSADVLIAVLTQQKYNDAAVKTFFRRAAEEGKVVIVVFNQCLLPEDEEYWPVWLDTFCTETGIEPESVYIAANDRRAAESNELPFLQRRSGDQPLDDQLADADSSNCSIRRDLSSLRFREIKLRTLLGSLKALADNTNGVPSYLEEIRRRSSEFASAAERFSSDSVVRSSDWPSIPNAILVDQVRIWWKSRQDGWARRLNGVYDAVGTGVLWPYRFARDKLSGPPIPPMDKYREREWAAALAIVEQMYDKLDLMSQSGSELLRPRLQALLGGSSRATLLERLKFRHEQVDLEQVVEQTVADEMKAFRDGSPDMYRFYRQINTVSAAVRPVTSAVLFSLGWGPAGEVVAPFVANAAAHAVVPIVVDMAGGATAALAGEAAVATAASSGAGFLQAKFQRLQTSFMTSRVNWLVDVLKTELLGTLPEELQIAASIPESVPWQAVVAELETINQLLAETQYVSA